MVPRSSLPDNLSRDKHEAADPHQWRPLSPKQARNGPRDLVRWRLTLVGPTMAMIVLVHQKAWCLWLCGCVVLTHDTLPASQRVNSSMKELYQGQLDGAFANPGGEGSNSERGETSPNPFDLAKATPVIAQRKSTFSAGEVDKLIDSTMATPLVQGSRKITPPLPHHARVLSIKSRGCSLSTVPTGKHPMDSDNGGLLCPSTLCLACPYRVILSPVSY